jgi:hypothetical protein
VDRERGEERGILGGLDIETVGWRLYGAVQILLAGG